jgi:outer membrane protein TolC
MLQRLIEQQELREAESKFKPRFTPEASLQVRQNLSGSDIASPSNDETRLRLGSQTSLTRRVGTKTELLTPLGTRLELNVDLFNPSEPLSLQVTQPLLQGAGQRINLASVNQARLTDSRNQLALRQTLTDTITNAFTQYNGLIQSQAEVDIQSQAVQRRQRQLEITQTLITAGRRAKIELANSERSLEQARRQLIEAKNRLNQANTNLLNQIGATTPLRIIIPSAPIEQLFRTAAARIPTLQPEQLIKTALLSRPDYLQAQLDVNISQYNGILAVDGQRWRLDLQSSTRLGTSSETTLGLLFNRTFGDQQQNTVVIRNRVELQQRQNRLAQLTETIRNEVVDRYNDLIENQARIETAQKEVAAAQLELTSTQERFRRGTSGLTLSDIINSEEQLVNAQNAQLAAQISLLNSIAELEKSIGITLNTWGAQIDLSPVLQNSSTGGK